MPTIGLSRPYAAIYNENGAGKVTYSRGVRAGRAVSWGLTTSSSESNTFRADNADAESTSGIFSSGELTLETAELDQLVSSLILGTKFEEMDDGSGGKVRVQIFDDDMKAPNMGYGVIEKKMVHGVVLWRAVVLAKVKFNVPDEAATTQQETISWGTDTITAKVMRDDTATHRWKIDAMFDSESKADAFICHVLGITDAGLDILEVISAAGTDVGTTTISVDPDLASGRTYRYLTGPTAVLPALHADLSSWDSWDGVADIAADTGDKIVIAEVDNTHLAMAAGIAVVTAKEA